MSKSRPPRFGFKGVTRARRRPRSCGPRRAIGTPTSRRLWQNIGIGRTSRSGVRVRRHRPGSALVTPHPLPKTAVWPAGPTVAVRRPIATFAGTIAVLAGLALAPAAAEPSTGASQPRAPEAERAVARLGERLVTTVNDASKDTGARERALENALRAALDFDALADFVLGRYAAELSADQKATFQRTFSAYVVGTYARVMAGNAIDDLDVVKSRKVSADTAAVATRVARRTADDTRWIWRLHRREPGCWGVVDLQTPAASLAVNYRSAFGNLLDRRGFDGLIQQIHAHTKREAVLPSENRAILMLIRGLQANRLALTAQ
nr:ABC transporter substrate-binding protein [Rhodovibrio sodomensis]